MQQKWLWLFLLVLLIGIHSQLQATAKKGAGFSAESTITIDFDENYYQYSGQTRIVEATVTVQEVNGRSGEVTVAGPGTIEPSTFTLSTGHYSQEVSVTLPADKNFYSYTASSLHADATAMTSAPEIVYVFGLKLETSAASIAAGGKNTPIHQCTLTATVEPASAGSGNVTFAFVDGQAGVGNGHDAALSATSGVFAGTPITVTLTSSNKVTPEYKAATETDPEVAANPATVSATYRGVTVIVDVAFGKMTGVCVIDPTRLYCDGESTADLSLAISFAGQAVSGHSITWRIHKIIDANNHVVYNAYTALDARNPVDNYGSISQSTGTTNAVGVSTALYTVGTLPGIIYIESLDEEIHF